jgi:hypothetical protein
VNHLGFDLRQFDAPKLLSHTSRGGGQAHDPSAYDGWN